MSTNISRDIDQSLFLNCSIVIVNLLPSLRWLKLKDNKSASWKTYTVAPSNKEIDTSDFTVLSNSSQGSVEYTVTKVTKEHDGIYVCAAIYYDSAQLLKTVRVVIIGDPAPSKMQSNLLFHS